MFPVSPDDDVRPWRETGLAADTGGQGHGGRVQRVGPATGLASPRRAAVLLVSFCPTCTFSGPGLLTRAPATRLQLAPWGTQAACPCAPWTLGAHACVSARGPLSYTGMA